jgi:transposase
LHLILDNYATHKHPKAMRSLAAHLHFTPTSASWLNLVERSFRDLSQEVIFSGSFGSTNELVDAIWGYLDERNLKPQRYQWRADGKVILGKIRRAREALEQNQPIVKD